MNAHNGLRLVMLLTLLSSSCASHRQSDFRNEAPETVCEYLSPYNDAKVMKEWKKIEQRLQSHGISVTVVGSIGAAACTKPQQAGNARAIISEMIRNGEVDTAVLQLRIITNQIVQQDGGTVR